MDWTKITKYEEVKRLLKKRQEIEYEIISIDKTAIVMYELEVLSLPNTGDRVLNAIEIGETVSKLSEIADKELER